MFIFCGAAAQADTHTHTLSLFFVSSSAFSQRCGMCGCCWRGVEVTQVLQQKGGVGFALLVSSTM